MSVLVNSSLRPVFLVMVGALLITLGDQSGAATLESITLHHRTADEVIPYVQPLLDGDDAVVTGRGSQLLIKATPAQFEQIRAVVETLDSPARRLLVTVGQLLGVDDSRIDYQDRSPTRRRHAKVTKTTTPVEDQIVQRLQVLDGREALIDIGQLVPEIESFAVKNGILVQELAEIRYRPVTDGFYVLPRVTGDRVTVEVRPYRRRESIEGGGRIQTQSLHTTVSGALGEWLTVGAAHVEAVNLQGRVTRSTRTLRRSSRTIMIKIEELH